MEYVASTRIRAARNISGFSLPSGATVADRAGVEKVLMHVRTAQNTYSNMPVSITTLRDNKKDYVLRDLRYYELSGDSQRRLGYASAAQD